MFPENGNTLTLIFKVPSSYEYNLSSDAAGSDRRHRPQAASQRGRRPAQQQSAGRPSPGNETSNEPDSGGGSGDMPNDIQSRTSADFPQTPAGLPRHRRRPHLYHHRAVPGRERVYFDQNDDRAEKKATANSAFMAAGGISGGHPLSPRLQRDK